MGHQCVLYSWNVPGKCVCVCFRESDTKKTLKVYSSYEWSKWILFEWTKLQSPHRWAVTFKDAHAYGNAVYTCLFEEERDELELDRNRLNDSR